MHIAQKGIIAASFAVLLTVSAGAMAAPPGKADYNFDPAAENASRYSGSSAYNGYGYNFGYANPYAAYGSYGTEPYGAMEYGEPAYPTSPAAESGED